MEQTEKWHKVYKDPFSDNQSTCTKYKFVGFLVHVDCLCFPKEATILSFVALVHVENSKTSVFHTALTVYIHEKSICGPLQTT